MSVSTFRAVAWALYLIGFALVVGSWLRLVSPGLGWAGWIVGMVGWGIFQIPKMRKPTPEDRLRDLEELHLKGLVSDEEYSLQRERILSGR